VFAQRSDTGRPVRSAAVADTLALERDAGVCSPAFYEDFQRQAMRIKHELLAYLLHCRQQGVTVAAYGAAAKGNTLLNFAGVRPDLLSFVVDRNPAKQGRFLPGSRIPVLDESALKARRPGRILVLPWNLRSEVVAQLAYARQWGARFVVAVPRLEDVE
jgi:hypothetical protein